MGEKRDVPTIQLLPAKVLVLFYVPDGKAFKPVNAFIIGLFHSQEGIARFMTDPWVSKRTGTWVARSMVVIP